MSFWGELRRRNVGRVAAAYAVLGWLLIQISVAVFPQLNLPSWSATLVTVLLLLGLPVALLFAWVFEVTPEGIKRTADIAPAESITRSTGQKLNYVITGLLALAVGFLLLDRFVLDPSATAPATIAAAATSAAPPDASGQTIAVLPFSNLSSDPEQGYFADGLSEELLNSLAQITELRVTARTSSFTFKGTTQTVQQIGQILGVEHILEGSVRKAANTVRVTAQLIRTGDGFHLWSETYDRSLDDIFAVQEEIAMAVADKLSATFGIGRPAHTLGGTDNPKAYEIYLAARGQNHNPNTAPAALQAIDAALALDPEFGQGWLLKASIQSFLMQLARTDRVAELQDEIAGAARKALEIEPELTAGHMVLASMLSERHQWLEAEASFRRAFELSGEPANGYSYALHLLALGHFGPAYDLLETARQSDPLNQSVRGFSLFARALAGDLPGAEEEYVRGTAQLGDTWLGSWFITMARLETGAAFDPADVAQRGAVHNEVIERLATPAEALVWLRETHTDNPNLSAGIGVRLAVWAAALGDAELALDELTRLVRVRGVNALHFWVPAMREVRQHPRFKALLRETRIIEHWNEYGWPDICRPLAGDDFECA